MTRTFYLVQEYSELGQRWQDLDGQITGGYVTADEAREAFAPRREYLENRFGYEGRYRLVERTVTETAHEI